MPVVVSVLPEDEPIEEPLLDVLGEDEVDELVSLLLVDGVLELLEDGELEPLDDPVPDAPMLELEEGDELLEVEGDVVLLEAPVDGEAPMVLLPLVPLLPEVVGALEPVELELGEVLLLEPVVGVLLLVPVPLPLVEPAPLLLPADVPAPDVPPVWATA